MNSAGTGSYIVPSFVRNTRNRVSSSVFKLEPYISVEFDSSTGVWFIFAYWHLKDGEERGYRYGPWATVDEANYFYDKCQWNPGYTDHPGQGWNQSVRPLLYDMEVF